MFTGIIETVGRIKSIRGLSGGKELEVEAPALIPVNPGESIALNGVCLTASSSGPDGFRVDVSPGSMSRSNLGKIRIGERVNLERALKMDGRLGGHLVLGHVDGVGTVRKIETEANSRRVWIRFPGEVAPYLVPRGSVAVEGISLTVAEIRRDEFSVAVVPFTWDNTNLADKRAGAEVNLEADLIGKYVEKFSREQMKARKIDWGKRE